MASTSPVGTTTAPLRMTAAARRDAPGPQAQRDWKRVAGRAS
jgi:hypothetical protein